MKHVLRYCLVSLALFACSPILAADSNTVSSTVVTDKAPPTASAPSVVVNNSDVCKSAAAASVQTQVLGFATGVTITDQNCERIKLARSLYGMGMKVAAVSTLCMDYRVFDAMWMAGTPCPFMGQIGKNAKETWEKNIELIPEGSDVKVIYEVKQVALKEEKRLAGIKAKKDTKEKLQLAKQEALQIKREEKLRANEYESKNRWSTPLSILAFILLL